MQRRHLYHHLQETETQRMSATVPQRISTAKIQISLCDANVCFLHNDPAFLFLSVIVEVLSLYFLLRLFPASLKAFAPKNQLYFPYSLFPFLGVPFPFSLVLPIFLHHKNPAYNVLQCLVLCTAIFFNNIILYFVCLFQHYQLIFSCLVHTSVCLKGLFSILFSHTRPAMFYQLLIF